jgi:hypothetical protein
MSVNIAERIGSEDELYRRMGDNWKNNLRVCIPGIIQSFNADTQTVTVKPAIREKVINADLTESWVELPLLVDVPIVLPRAGNFILTMPITAGDECLVIFGDVCIDAWYSLGKIQNQIDKRRHDLSDGFALLGCWSQPNVIPNYSTNSVQLRNEAGTSYIELKDAQINLVAASVKINNKEFSTHTHSAPSGGGTTSGVL